MLPIPELRRLIAAPQQEPPTIAVHSRGLRITGALSDSGKRGADPVHGEATAHEVPLSDVPAWLAPIVDPALRPAVLAALADQAAPSWAGGWTRLAQGAGAYAPRTRRMRVWAQAQRVPAAGVAEGTGAGVVRGFEPQQDLRVPALSRPIQLEAAPPLSIVPAPYPPPAATPMDRSAGVPPGVGVSTAAPWGGGGHGAGGAPGAPGAPGAAVTRAQLVAQRKERRAAVPPVPTTDRVMVVPKAGAVTDAWDSAAGANDTALVGPWTPALLGQFRAVRAAVGPVQRDSLDNQARRMHQKVREFLIQLGRDPSEMGTGITMVRRTWLAYPDKKFGLENGLQLTGAEIASLIAAQRRTAVMGARPKGDPMTSDEPIGTLMAVSGPVYSLFDGQQQTLPDEIAHAAPLFCVSTPGINFSYGDADQTNFIVNESIHEPRAMARMQLIWAHTLALMQQSGVKHAVLCAIGCGAFKGNHVQVANLYARALYGVLAVGQFGFETVTVCLPSFNDDNYERFRTEAGEFAGTLADAGVRLFLARDQSMLSFATQLGFATRERVGILNPSDWEAVVEGKMGMYWDGGHIALEEIMAMALTLLFAHKGFNPKAFTPETIVDIPLPEQVTRFARENWPP